MKLLVFYPYVPYPLDRGAYHRAFHLLKGLARDHQVDLIALAENGAGLEHRSLFEQFCHRVRFVPFVHPPWQKLFPVRFLNPWPSTTAHWTIPEVGEALDAFIEATRYDAVHVCDIVLAQYFLRQRRHLPLVADRTRVDLQYQLMERRRMNFAFKTRLLNYENLLKLWFYERAVARRAAVEVVCGPDDEAFLRRFIQLGMHIEVIPNGVDLEYFSPPLDESDRAPKPTILFCGAMDYNPNIDALRWYFAEIDADLRQRVPDLRLLIVGKDPVPEVRAYAARPNVIVTGSVPDVRPYYRQAWLQIVPLRIGGGTRLKIVESLALKTPVVSTTIGAQGLDLRHGHDILLADTREAFVQETAQALQSTSLRAQLAARGLETARNRLSWPSLSQQLSQLYHQFERRPAPHSPPARQLVSSLTH